MSESIETDVPTGGTHASKKPRKAKAAPNLSIVGRTPPNGDDPPAEDDVTTAPAGKRKQLEVPGTAPPRNRKVENAALTYRTAFLERIEQARAEDNARGHLRMVMEQEGVKSCRITDGEGDEVVFVLDTPDAKIKMKKVGGDED